MAESSSGNWWGDWLQAAKEKSAQTLELIKHDLSEFTTVCSQDASAVVSNTTERLQGSLQNTGEDGASAATKMVKKGLTDLLGGITKALTIPPEDDEEVDVLRVTSGGSLEVFDKAKARLFEIQTSPQTYCTEPDGPQEQFDTWRSTFDLEAKKGEISDLLVSVNEVRSIYTKLVPSAVSHADFWGRYFYRVYQLNQDELRKSDLKKRADQLKIENSEQDWEDDWESEEPPAELSSRTQPEVVANLEPTLSAAAASPVEQAAAIPISSNDTLSSLTTTADTESLSAAVASDDDRETHQGTPSVNIPTSVLVDPSAPLVADSLLLDSKTQSVETTHTTNDVETTLATSAVETTPVTNDVEKTPATNDVETTPVTSAVETTPATSAEKTTPTTSDVETTPVTSAVETTSVTSAVETTPVTNAVETTHKHEMEEDLELMNQSDVQPSPQNSVTTPETEVVTSNSKKEHGEVSNLTAQEKTESDTLTDSVDKVDLVSIDEGGKKVAVKEKGDFLMVGSDRPTPASSVGSTKSSGLDDDWDKDLFGEDLKAVQELAEQISAGKEDINLDDDWESWE